jgi:hypothetical protein
MAVDVQPSPTELDVRLSPHPALYAICGDRPTQAASGRNPTTSARPIRWPSPASPGRSRLSATRLAFLDVTTGSEAGSIDTTDAIRPLRIAYLDDDRRTIRLDALHDDWILDLPATAQAWRDKLCAALGRDLTTSEGAILPPGANTEPPCS